MRVLLSDLESVADDYDYDYGYNDGDDDTNDNRIDDQRFIHRPTINNTGYTL